jgi:hypothetical protein
MKIRASLSPYASRASGYRPKIFRCSQLFNSGLARKLRGTTLRGTLDRARCHRTIDAISARFLVAELLCASNCIKFLLYRILSNYPTAAGTLVGIRMWIV